MPLPLLPALLLAVAPALTTPQDTVPLYNDLGNYHHAISTTVPQAQRYFDQGIRLVFAFNHREAIRAFDEAARLDPTCAICRWGAALAYGPHVNAPMDSASGVAAWQELQQAVALAPRASAVEQAYIRALTARYAATPPADRSSLDSAYANAMAALVRQNPNDLDAATLYAEALMDLRPWNYWQKDGSPYPGTDIIVTQLERVIAADSTHPGACHYYMHAVEAVAPEKAVPCAERLAAEMPGAGHMVHMPAHIYIRLGRWNDAIMTNKNAVRADETYIAAEHPQGIYPMGYYPHNYHFLAFASMMAGRSAEAISAARRLVAAVPADVARQVSAMEPMLPYAHFTLLTFGQWDDVLKEPMPPGDLRLSTGLAYYARGVAYAAKGDWTNAQAAADTVRQISAGTTPADQNAMTSGEGENKKVIDIAMHSLLGEIAARRGNLAEAEGHFRAAAEIEDSFNYVEPPQWYYPVRFSLGAVLLKEGKAADAEMVYRADLKRFPENGWDLFGLAASLRAQGKTGEAAEVEARFARAWSQADVKLTGSRF